MRLLSNEQLQDEVARLTEQAISMTQSSNGDNAVAFRMLEQLGRAIEAMKTRRRASDEAYGEKLDSAKLCQGRR